MIAALLETVEKHAGRAAWRLRKRADKRHEDAVKRADGKWMPDTRDVALTHLIDLVARGMSEPTRIILREGIMAAAMKQHDKDHPPQPLGFTWGDRTSNGRDL